MSIALMSTGGHDVMSSGGNDVMSSGGHDVMSSGGNDVMSSGGNDVMSSRAATTCCPLGRQRRDVHGRLRCGLYGAAHDVASPRCYDNYKHI